MLDYLRAWASTHRKKLNLVTKWIIWATVILWVVWDIFVWMMRLPTESRRIADWGSVSMFLPYALGCLLGHWFWLWKGDAPEWKGWRFFTMLGFGVLLGAWDLFDPSSFVVLRDPAYWAVIGFPTGHYLYPQNQKVFPSTN